MKPIDGMRKRKKKDEMKIRSYLKCSGRLRYDAICMIDIIILSAFSGLILMDSMTCLYNCKICT
jgi:hypothetical protein